MSSNGGMVSWIPPSLLILVWLLLTLYRRGRHRCYCFPGPACGSADWAELSPWKAGVALLDGLFRESEDGTKCDG